MSSRASEDDDDDELDFDDDDLDLDDEPRKKGKNKAKSSTTKSSGSKKSSKAAGVSVGGGGTGSYAFLTAAEQREQGKKDEKKAAESPYSFLLNVKDVRRIACLLKHLLLMMRLQKDGRKPTHPDYDPRTIYIPDSAWGTFTPFEKQVCRSYSDSMIISFSDHPGSFGRFVVLPCCPVCSPSKSGLKDQAESLRHGKICEDPWHNFPTNPPVKDFILPERVRFRRMYKLRDSYPFIFSMHTGNFLRFFIFLLVRVQLKLTRFCLS